MTSESCETEQSDRTSVAKGIIIGPCKTRLPPGSCKTKLPICQCKTSIPITLHTGNSLHTNIWLHSFNNTRSIPSNSNDQLKTCFLFVDIPLFRLDRTYHTNVFDCADHITPTVARLVRWYWCQCQYKEGFYSTTGSYLETCNGP